jgi:hypothetical protein
VDSCQVAYRLNNICQKMEGFKNFLSLTIDGRQVNLPEDTTFWSQLCGNVSLDEPIISHAVNQ